MKELTINHVMRNGGEFCFAPSLQMKKPLAALTKMMLNAVDKRLSKFERGLWQKQAWFAAKRIENGELNDSGSAKED